MSLVTSKVSTILHTCLVNALQTAETWVDVATDAGKPARMLPSFHAEGCVEGGCSG